MRTLLIYGNCQAHALGDMFRCDPVISGLFRVAFLRSYDRPWDEESFVSDADYAQCAILCEQVDWNAFPYRERLPLDCQTIRFPALDTNLLWPFNATNPYNVAEPPSFRGGRFPYGDRIINRRIEAGDSAEGIISYYLNQYDTYKVDLKRAREVEWFRLKKRDERCDFAMSDVIRGKLFSERMFVNVNHACKGPLTTLAERLIDACAAREPALRQVNVRSTMRENPTLCDLLLECAVPLHPAVAKELELSWFDPNEKYLLRDDTYYGFEEYVRALVHFCLAGKEKQSRGPMSRWGLPTWHPSIVGAARVEGATAGYYPDGFVGSFLRFDLLADQPLRGLTIRGFCPNHHSEALTLTAEIEGSRVGLARVEPGSMFALTCAAPIAAGTPVRFVMESSAVFNPLERGESEDNRDLSVLLLGIDADPALEIERTFE
jgi:hypothetical protein